MGDSKLKESGDFECSRIGVLKPSKGIHLT